MHFFRQLNPDSPRKISGVYLCSCLYMKIKRQEHQCNKSGRFLAKPVPEFCVSILAVCVSTSIAGNRPCFHATENRKLIDFWNLPCRCSQDWISFVTQAKKWILQLALIAPHFAPTIQVSFKNAFFHYVKFSFFDSGFFCDSDRELCEP